MYESWPHQEECDPLRLDPWKCNTPRYESCWLLQRNSIHYSWRTNSMTYGLVWFHCFYHWASTYSMGGWGLPCKFREEARSKEFDKDEKKWPSRWLFNYKASYLLGSLMDIILLHGSMKWHIYLLNNNILATSKAIWRECSKKHMMTNQVGSKG